MAQCATCVPKVYQGIIDDVVNGIRDAFLDEGIDEQVLVEFKQAWEQKLATTRATSHQIEGGSMSATAVAHQTRVTPQHTAAATPQPPQPQSLPTNLVPVQITVPAQQAGGVPKTITIHVPSTALANGVAGVQLQNILSSASAAATFALDETRAADIIQRKLNRALQENGIVLPPQLLQYNGTTQVDGPVDCLPVLGSSNLEAINSDQPGSSGLSVTASSVVLDALVLARLCNGQLDGGFGLGDSSEEMSDDDDDEDDDDEDADDGSVPFDPDGGAEERGDEDEPLNSSDDVSDDDDAGGDAFETDNVVVCQYDKITRVRNRWKFHLKDGIMSLKGKDYVFQKATGEGEW